MDPSKERGSQLGVHRGGVIASKALVAAPLFALFSRFLRFFGVLPDQTLAKRADVAFVLSCRVAASVTTGVTEAIEQIPFLVT